MFVEQFPLVLNHELGALNRAALLHQQSWSNAFSSNASRLTSYADAEFRGKILSITQVSVSTVESSFEGKMSKNQIFILLSMLYGSV